MPSGTTPPASRFDDSAMRLLKLAGLMACIALSVLYWSHPVLWPLKLLVVMMHESGHAFAALLMGGQVQRIVLSANEAGACLSLLPQGIFRQIVVSSAGYLG